MASAIALSLVPRASNAQQRPPGITDNNYAVQFHQGPVTSATRIIGLAGAYAALAENTEGVYANSAAPAVRVPWSATRFDYDVGLSLAIPGAFQNTDFENRGRVGRANRFSNSYNIGAGLQAQYGGFGASFVFDTSSFNLEQGAPTPFSAAAGGNISLNQGMLALGYGFISGQLLIGGGLRGAFLGVVSGAVPNLAAFAVAPHVGAIWSPARMPLRIGVSYRDTVEVTDIRGTGVRADGAQIAQARILPSRAVLPWELQFGVMLGLGGWPDNGEWIDPQTHEAPVRRRYEEARLARVAVLEQRVRTSVVSERAELRENLEREEALAELEHEHKMNLELRKLEQQRERRWNTWSRRGIMVVADLLITGSSPNSVGLEDFLDQQRVPFGGDVTMSPRAAVETEVWPNWVKVRTGSYVEPSRFRDGYPRSHFTGGIDVRLFVFNPWGLLSKAPLRLRLAGDVAPRYSNFSLGIGTWH